MPLSAVCTTQVGAKAQKDFGPVLTAGQKLLRYYDLASQSFRTPNPAVVGMGSEGKLPVQQCGKTMLIIRDMIAKAREHPAKGWVWLYSPTRALIMTFGAEQADAGSRSIRSWMKWCLRVTLALATLLYFVNLSVNLRLEALNHCWIVYLLLWFWPYSRTVEICRAFYDDAMQVLAKLPRRTTLTAAERLRFLAGSYLEVATNFGLIYFFWADGVMSAKDLFGRHFASPIEAIYFSFVTITTLGYGDITPKTLPGQLLCMTELVCGFVLIVFAFGSYMASAGSPPASKTDAESTSGTPPRIEPSERLASQTLEQVQVSWQRSRQFKTIEWLKGLAGLAAIIGLAVAFLVNSRQLAELAASRDEERFDKAVSRLGSQSPSERLTGLEGLKLFLEPSQKARHQPVLLFLANAVAIEKDATVRGAILDTFASLRQYPIEQQVLNDTLAAERDRNRSILKTLQARFQKRVNENTETIFEKGNDEVGVGNLSPEDLSPLQATATTIASLVRSGAYLQDLSDIYCVSCVFSSDDRSVNLSNVRFDRSYLRRASFAKVILENSSFDGAYLIQTDFTSADLRRAKLTDPPLVDPPIQAILIQKALWAASGPIFECADLTEADFHGSVMFGFYWTDIYGTGYFPRFFGANLSHAKLDSFTIFTAIPTDVAARTKTSGNFPGDIFPIKYAQSAGSGNIAVEGWMKKKYLITSYAVGKDFQFIGPIPPMIWQHSMYAALNSLASAKNLKDAEMPAGLRAFMVANSAVLSRTIISTTCPATPGS